MCRKESDNIVYSVVLVEIFLGAICLGGVFTLCCCCYISAKDKECGICVVKDTDDDK